MAPCVQSPTAVGASFVASILVQYSLYSYSSIYITFASNLCSSIFTAPIWATVSIADGAAKLKPLT